MDETVCLSPIDAPHPDPERRGKLLKVSVNSETVRNLARTGRHNDIFAMFYNLCGVVPPVNNIGYHEKEENFSDSWGGLKHSHLIYKGLKRPFHKKNHASSVYIYVTSPKYVYQYVSDMACVAKRIEAPRNAVFVAYVVFPKSDYQEGEVLSWEWIVAESGNSSHPKNLKQRYDEEVWRNG